MGFWNLVSQRRIHTKIHQLASRVAASSLASVVARLRQDVSRMTPAEAAGYVRARASVVVRAQVAAMIASGSSLTAMQQDHLVNVSLDMVTRHAIDHMKRPLSRPRLYRIAA